MGDIDKLKFWCQKILPLVYDDSLSYYELLCKVVKYLNDVINKQNEMGEILDQFAPNIGEIENELKYLQSELDKVKNGDYVSLYIDSLSKWINENLQEMVSKIVKFVTFGLSNSGYFVAYIPDTWDFINFDTIVDTNDPLYGHLILKWG